MDFVYLFYTPNKWQMIIQNTNKYASKVVTNWKNVTTKDIFIMGLIRINKLRDYLLV